LTKIWFKVQEKFLKFSPAIVKKNPCKHNVCDSLQSI